MKLNATGSRPFILQCKHFLYADDKRCGDIVLRTAHMKLTSECQNYQHVQKINMHVKKHQSGKDILVEEHRKSPAFLECNIFVPINALKRWMNNSIFKYNKTKKDDPNKGVINLI